MPDAREKVVIFRHPLWLRVTHWINAICVIFLFMSGLQIFNAHPALYFGAKSTFAKPSLSIDADEDGKTGRVTAGGHTVDTTGVLGLSRGAEGDMASRAFPRWATLPADQDLATARRWHFLFAWLFVFNGFAYLALGVATGHLFRDIAPRFKDLASLPKSLWDHLLLRFEDGRRYNVLQKLSYGFVVIIFPVMAAAGLAMSPGMDAFAPILPEIFGGRQSARSVHFIIAFALLAFFIVHVAMVVLAGPFNEMRSMITGRFSIPRDAEDKK